jgi:hypothetical protein
MCINKHIKKFIRRYRWPRGLRHRSAAPLVPGIAGSNPDVAHGCWSLYLYAVLSCVGRGLCDGLITR